MLNSILIANRGEIASRIIRTCRKLGIITVAIVEERELNAKHSLEADHYAVIDSYLNIAAIVAVAKSYSVEAIHPGYGYLSENAEFAKAIIAAGIKFVGPSVEAMELMGSKANAKQVAQSNNIPIIPGYQGDADFDTLRVEAEKIGFPILIKAALGGGGKGLRRVDSMDQFKAHLDGARREAEKAFASTEVILEAYLENPRHVEVQIVADQHGNIAIFGDRDCSLQRRYQKVIEEAPAPFIASEIRQSMHDCARKLASVVKYEGAGTIEFLLLPDGKFFFLEMNTRLQVEHPVTEEIFKVDLVEQQLRVASGEILNFDNPQPEGHAVEVRLYAEDPYNKFLPTTGCLEQLDLPDCFRQELSYRQNDNVTIHYDPMIAKLIAVADTRLEAYEALQSGLSEVDIQGLTTNIDYLRQLISHPKVVQTVPDTGFIETLAMGNLPSEVLIAAALWLSQNQSGTKPWEKFGWRLNSPNQYRFDFIEADGPIKVSLLADYAIINYGDDSYTADHISSHGNTIVWHNAETNYRAEVLNRFGNLIIIVNENSYSLRIYDIHQIDLNMQEDTGHLLAPMPGQITAVMVDEGEEVDKGHPLMVLEAMKMEHTIIAPSSGQVKKLFFKKGDFVDDKEELISIVA